MWARIEYRSGRLWSFGQTASGGVLQLMAICQKCGKDNPPAAAICSECGAPLPKRKAQLAGTMVGMPSPVGPGGPLAPNPAPKAEPQAAQAQPTPAQPAPQQPAPQQPAAAPSPARKGALAGTMIGMPSPVAKPGGPTPAPPAAAAGTPQEPKKNPALGQTMVGTGSPGTFASPDPAPSPAPQGAAPAAQGAPGEKKAALKGTLLGIAQPGIAPDPNAPAPPGAAGGAKFKGTLLGVAQPGITPDQDASTPPPAEPAAPVAPAPQSAPIEPAGVPQRASISPKQLMFVGAAVLFAGLVGGAIAVLGPKPVAVTVEKFAIDENGNDKLELACADCPEGSTLILDGAQAEVKNGKASLSPRASLSLGRNDLEFQLKDGEDVRRVKPVVLPIAFRVLTNWTGLTADPPYAEVTVAAPEGSKVSIDGKDIPIKGEKAVHQVAFAKVARGEAAKMEQVDANLAIVVTVDGEPRKTQAELRNGITPLTLSSPAPVHHLEGKPLTVSGQTAPGAQVAVGGSKGEADGKGRFTIVVDSPTEGELVVTAQAKDLVMRRVALTLSKSAEIPEDPVTNFSEVKPGVAVNLSANVIESRTAAGTTRALLEVDQGCETPPCLIRAVYGEPRKLSPNRRVRVTGLVSAGNPLTVRVRRFR